MEDVKLIIKEIMEWEEFNDIMIKINETQIRHPETIAFPFDVETAAQKLIEFVNS
ncbi:MAG: hypothetical protein NC548_22850 [Lachnospiraceae bacterium]|nr:hypothetical protein [Lachnospiraceae bacterium]